MIFDVINWMNTRRIPESNIERNKLTNLIYTARCMYFYSLLSRRSISCDDTYNRIFIDRFRYLIGPFIICYVLGPFYFIVLARNSEFVINSTPLNEVVLEAKAKEIDYLSDNDEDD